MQEVQTIDSLLNADLSGVDTSFPVLAAGVVSCVIAAMSVGESKEKKTPMLVIKLTTAAAAQSTKGVSINAGFPIRDQVVLQASYEEDGTTKKYDPLKRLATIKEAVFGEKSGPFGDPALYVGKPVTIRIKIESSVEFGDQNKVAGYVKLAG